jgi:hypothetical protein
MNLLLNHIILTCLWGPKEEMKETAIINKTASIIIIILQAEAELTEFLTNMSLQVCFILTGEITVEIQHQ